MENGYDVFLSRKSQDAHLAKEIYDFLTSKGLKVFDSEHSLLEMGNTDYSRVIDDALVKTEHLIVVGSSIENITSSWVEAEWRFFLNRKRAGKIKGNLLTVVTKEVKIDDLPPSLQNYEVILFNNRKERILPYVLRANPKKQYGATSKEEKSEVEVSKIGHINLKDDLEETKIEQNNIINEEKTVENINHKETNNKEVIEKIGKKIKTRLIMVIMIPFVTFLGYVGNSIYEDYWNKKYYEENSSVTDSVSSMPVDSARVIDYSSMSDEELEKNAIDGIAEAQFWWGKRSDDKQYYGIAMQWYLKAAAQGNAAAKNNIGVLYLRGNGVKQDYTQAMQWFIKAAKQGYAFAQIYVGILYHQGLGINQDYSEAMRWFLKAAKQGNASAQRNIGGLYFHGQGVKKDKNIAKEWFLKAAKQGDVSAQYELKDEYGITNY